MTFDSRWRNFRRLTEAKEETPFKSKAQKRYKAQRRRNDIYTTMGGIKNKKSGHPFSGKVKRFGTDRLRFEGLRERIEKAALKSFEVQDTLEPNIWEDGKLNPEVRNNLLKIARDFLIDLPFKIEPEDITLTGSLANYNWSKYSDIDLHIVIPFSAIDDNIELVRELFRNLQTNWNAKHDIRMSGYEVEIYFQDSEEPHISTGLYSIQNDEWIKQPRKETISLDYVNMEKKARDLSDRISEIEKMMDKEDLDTVLDAVDRLRQKVRNMRKTGLETTGQYSVENLAFKVLRRSGELDRLADLKAKAYDETLSLPE